MKTKLSLLILSSFFLFAKTLISQETQSTKSFDHKVEIAAMAGYQLNGTLNFIQGDIRFNDNVNYALALSVNLGYDTYVEAAYSICRTDARLRTWYPGFEPENPFFDVSIQYYQLGGVKEFLFDRVRPFGSLSAGASAFIPIDSQLDAWWQFAVNLGAGVKIHITENIGFRAQARLLMPMYFSGIGIFCGGGGCSSGLTTTSNIIQGDFMGGLIIGF